MDIILLSSKPLWLSEPGYAGTCYRAANWIKVGHIKGRERQDKHHEYGTPVESLRMYPLVRDWRERLIEAFPHNHPYHYLPNGSQASGGT